MVTVADLIATGCRTRRLVSGSASPHLPTRYGEFQLTPTGATSTREEHLALVMGEIDATDGAGRSCASTASA